MTTAITKAVKIADNDYMLTFNISTLCVIEKQLDVSIFDLFNGRPLAADEVGGVWNAVLQRAHQLSREDSDKLIDEVGLSQTMDWIGEGIGGYLTGVSEKRASSPKRGKAEAPEGVV